MKKLINALFALAFFGMFITACKDDATTEPVAEKGLLDSVVVKNLVTYTSGTTDTIKLFSLKDNKEIPLSELKTTNWDIAFWRTTIWTNSGVIGPGNGGAIVLKGSDFQLLKEVPKDSAFATEVSVTQKAIPSGSGNGWYNYDGAKMEIAPISGRLLIIRTADGKHYAKVQILSYYQGYPDSIPSDVMKRVDKCYSFKFSYQPKDTTSFLKI